MNTLPLDRMPEAEVSLRLAIHLARSGHVIGDVDVAIDGAQVKNLSVVHFPMNSFLLNEGLRLVGGTAGSWQGVYELENVATRLRIHSNPGLGDVVARLRNGRRLRVESKKGTLERSRSSAEYPLIREAIGQIMTVEDVSDTDLLGIAVPRSSKFEELCSRWSSAPLIRRVGILLIRVGRNGTITGLPPIAEPSVTTEAAS